jgi:methyl-accepting chemotaxis protein
MRLKTRVLVIVMASLVGLVVMGAFGLYSMRESMMEERRAQIAQLLDFGGSQLQYFQGLEAAGKLTREEAQKRAKEAIGAQRQGTDNYFFIRNLKDDYFLLHPIASRLEKPDDGGKMPDGRSVVQTYRDELAKSKDNKAFLELNTLKPGSDKKDALYPKLNGVLKFDAWGWMLGIGFYIDDIDTRFWQQSSIFILVGSVLLAFVAALVFRMRLVILRQLGGEPQDAAESMKTIANGNLGVEIVLQKGDDSSLMASLKVMQMKLINLTSAVQENAQNLADQVKGFDDVANKYAETRSDDDLFNLNRSIKKMGKTAEILGKSISRFKL